MPDSSLSVPPASDAGPGRRRHSYDILVLMLLLLALILAAGSFAVFRSIKLEREARVHGREVATAREELSQILGHVSMAESAQRGFLVTGSAAYLGPYAEAEAETFVLFDRLAGLPGRRQDRREALAALRELAQDKFAEMQQTIDLARGGAMSEARALVLTDRGRQIMDRIEAQTRDLIEAERRAMDASYATVDRRQRSLLFQVAILTVAALGTLLLAAWAIRQRAHAQAEAAWLSEVRAQRDRADLIRREMSHRVKNLFAVIMSIISTTARTETDPRAAAAKTRQRVQALARAHSLSSGQEEFHGATFRALLDGVAGPYRPIGRSFVLEGPEVPLPAQVITPLGLILNELATNAIKYGGWAGDTGTVSASWQLIPPSTLDFTWKETEIAPRNPVSDRPGFGTVMIDLSVQQAGGTAAREWTDEGFAFRMQVPLTDLPVDRMDKARHAGRG